MVTVPVRTGLQGALQRGREQPRGQAMHRVLALPRAVSHTGQMSQQAKLTVRVGSNRGSSNIGISTSGRYVNLATNAINETMPQQPIQPTSSAKAFWLSVLVIVQAEIEALP